MGNDTQEQIPQMDWQQVAFNGGPPCFFVEGPQYCGRAERWHGHGNTAFHDYVSLGDLLATVRKETKEEAQGNYEYAVRLATVMRQHFYPDNEEWQPLETLSGVLSQIDNMIAGLIKRSAKPMRSFRIQEPTGPF